jgi:hypothetical protein
MVTQETKDFWIGSNLAKDNSPTSCILVFLTTIDVAVEIVLDLTSRSASTPRFISKGGEITRKVTESVTI